MYHYTDGGLRNVRLANGYEINQLKSAWVETARTKAGCR